ncbi:ornithine cyclodeaminase [Rodentibacter pneumotropicus]|uniref:Ornithine cyclodeaminase n=1 Tax=Rodentibacter pneumotropicus TaxID=758 RepID=A0A4S2PEE5_9PAST|nr:ornithine cyclodeaminase [Rodentibacter pneumotropicus]THA00777.1 ornithine cyclodeaminase [Rodentibacter pneumotropicus]THA01671.1 ornithine cyclodeaminase [Rodentibacter pneumotropicus]THA08755.1 ornithine cyclodeaminase [Rodentibacter pneumotropicus]THA15103.1 ornithine cyclodeaminase [Rodentibacter pneumotropicus]
MSYPSIITGSLPTIIISPQDVANIIQRQGIKKTLEGMKNYILDDYLNWNSFDKTSRISNHVPDGVLELMPIANQQQYSFKYVNCHPKNPNEGLSTILAFGALISNDTGQPDVISEFTLTTALRTAATSVLAAQYLARPNSKRMAIIGNGCQSEFQALAFYHLLGIEELALFDIDRKASEKLAGNLANTSLKIEIFDTVAQAVKNADIITTVTAEYSKASIITPEMIEAGMHINAVGGDNINKTELHVDVVKNAHVFVEFEPQTRIEGELQNMPADFPVTPLFEIFQKGESARQSEEEVTLFDSVGFAIEDFSAIRYMNDTAIKLGLARPLSLTPDLKDPKDLFGYLTDYANL